MFLIACIPCFGQITDFNFLYYNKDQGLPDNRIYDFQEDLKGRMWIATQTGVSCFDGKVFKNYIHPLKESTIETDWVGCHFLTIDNKGRIWEATTEQLFYLDESKDKFVEYDLSKIESSQNKDSWYSRIYLQDWKDERSIWFRKGAGIYAINSESMICNLKISIPLKYRSVWGVLGKDNEGNIGAGGAGSAAITFFHPNGTSFTTSDPIPSQIKSTIDPNGLDFNSRNGLLSATNIYQQEGKSQIWVGGEQLMSFDKSNGLWEKWSTGSTGVANYAGITTIPGLTGNYLLWMYSRYGNVVSCFNTLQKKFTIAFNTEHFDKNGLRCGLMNAMFVDSKNNIWLGGNAGVSILLSDLYQFEKYHSNCPMGTIHGVISSKTSPEPFTGGTWKMPDGSLAEWVADGLKIYYVALSDHSKAYFDGKLIDGEIIGNRIQVDFQTGKRMLKKVIYEKNKQGLWYEANINPTYNNTEQPFLLYWPATNNKIMDPKGEKFVLEKDLSGTWYTQNKDLVYIFQDDNLIAQVHPVHIIHSKLIKQNRIEGLEIRWWGGCRTEMAYSADIITPDSLLTAIRGLDTNCDLQKGFTGGGIIKRIHLQAGRDSIYIHTFRVFDKIQSINPGNYHQQTYTLDYTQNFLTFEFDCANPTYPLLWYKLDGFDHDWFQTRSNKSANYTNLDGGDYTFRVKATAENGAEMGQTATFKLHVNAPYYRTWWFYSLCFLSIGTIFYVIFYNRELQRLRQEQLRLSIARDLHDEVGSTLSSISILSESALVAVQKDLDQARFGNIGDKARTALESISDIVWSINPKNDSMAMVLARMSAFASEILEGAGTVLHFKSSEEVEKLTLPMGKRKDFYLFFKEAINNCAKHAHALHVEVKLEKQGNALILRVKDDGVGFDIQKTSAVTTNLGGNGLQNMYSRAKAIGADLKVNSTPGVGTELVLKVPLSS